MIQSATLARTDRQVSAFIEKHVQLAGAERKEEVFALFDNMHQFFPEWTIITCPMMHPTFSYVSPNCFRTFGYDAEFILNQAKPEKFFSHVHEADQHDVKACYAFLQKLLLETDPALHFQLRSILHYRFRRANGQYMYVHDEKASLELPGGRLYYALIRDITQERIFSGARIEIFRNDDGLQLVKAFRPSSGTQLLSKREQQLVQLIKQGLSTKEMAWHLNISHHTVRNIKSRLFQKFQVNNSIELLNVAV